MIGVATCSTLPDIAADSFHGLNWSITFDTPVPYCAPYASQPYTRTSYDYSTYWDEWSDAGWSYWYEFRAYGYTCTKFISTYGTKNGNYLSNLQILDTRSSLGRQALKCFFDACGECKNKCSITTYTNYTSDSIQWQQVPILGCPDHDKPFRVINYFEKIGGASVYLHWILLVIICIKEFIKICFMFGYFLSPQLQNSTVIKVFLNNPIAWIFLLNSQRLKNDLKQIKYNRERNTLRRFVDLLFEDVPSLCYAMWYIITSKSIQFVALFTLSGSLLNLLRNLYIISFYMKKDYLQTKQSNKTNTIHQQPVEMNMSNIVASSTGVNSGVNSGNVSPGGPLSVASFMAMDEQLQLVSIQTMVDTAVERKFQAHESQLQQIIQRMSLLERNRNQLQQSHNVDPVADC